MTTHCEYCQAAPQRLDLAEALESGRYRQTPEDERLDGILRDQYDQYSITGVATAELTTSVWVRSAGSWTAYPPDVLTKAFPTIQRMPKEFPDPHRKFLDQLQQEASTGTSMGCPEETACALGLHESTEGTGHPVVLWFRSDPLTPKQRAQNGIPPYWPLNGYVLDTLDFANAAALLREYPHLLEGHCACGLPLKPAG